jgi:hypothetical protein
VNHKNSPDTSRHKTLPLHHNSPAFSIPNQRLTADSIRKIAALIDFTLMIQMFLITQEIALFAQFVVSQRFDTGIIHAT